MSVPHSPLTCLVAGLVALLLASCGSESRTPRGEAPAPPPTLPIVWEDKGPPHLGTITLMETAQGIVLRRDFADGGQLDKIVEPVSVRRGTRYNPVPPDPHGDYYLVNRSGEFMIGDKNGIVRVVSARK